MKLNYSYKYFSYEGGLIQAECFDTKQINSIASTK